MAYNQRMFSTTFRILESTTSTSTSTTQLQFDYHWPLNGFGLPDADLEKGVRG